MFAVWPDPGVGSLFSMLAEAPVAQYGPSSAVALMFGVMLKYLWSTKKDWVVERATLLKDFKDEKAALVAYNDEALNRMQAQCVLTTDSLRRVHSDELASLNRRIDGLEAHIASLENKS